MKLSGKLRRLFADEDALNEDIRTIGIGVMGTGLGATIFGSWAWVEGVFLFSIGLVVWYWGHYSPEQDRQGDE
ncbi:MAG: hypothetical protein ACRESW_05505 [Nevskiales bacterium]